MACNTGGAEAARRAGYSAKGAKQRGAFLMRQPEIRVRVEQLRACRHATHQTLLDDAAAQVADIISDALEKKSCGLALRAIEFRLKLCGVIQDRRIGHHYHLEQRHPDADLEDLDLDPEEEFDALLSHHPSKAIAPPAPDDGKSQAKEPTSQTKPLRAPRATHQPDRAASPGGQIVTPDSDPRRFLPPPLPVAA
jgi:phage terminase small subunit